MCSGAGVYQPKVSIVIAVGVPGPYIEECIAHCLALDYPDVEIIALPDSDWTPPDPSVTVIPTGKVRPAEKRDRGVEASAGELVAIIDDDAYPDRDWLSKAVPHFADETDVDDYPTSSLIIRKTDFIAAGGFDTGYWPGEDTILCLKLVHELKKRIVYDPAVRVHHHRRNIFSPHLKQIKSYAFHRGFFVRRFPETSLKPAYFVPSAFTLFALLGWTTCWMHPALFTAWCGVMLLYGVLALVFSMRTPNPVGIAGTFLGTFFTHLTYGAWFLAGLFAREIHD